MGARLFVLVSALTVLAGPARADEVDPGARVVEMRDSVRKVIGGCTYTANVSGHYRHGSAPGAIRDVVVDVSSRLQCRNHLAVESQRQIYFAATRATELTARIGEAAMLEYAPRPGTL
ncbi:MAG: hypothetical protein WCJ30_28360, partial [Deltaproteobacteria bacterium]